ncbi:MAG TPA: hypothetical protein VGN13_12175 [Solirubrobacteraceae bacterium]|jgi:hypothetical protein
MLLLILAGLLREHGHKTTLNWIITGVVVLLGIGYRLYRRRSRR